MANYKRKKTRKNVRCSECNSIRWMGNNTGRLKPREEFAKNEFKTKTRREYEGK